MKTVQARHTSYFEAYLAEMGANAEGSGADLAEVTFDPIELSLYISRRLQTDNDWLVDKLAQV